ncbi:SRPBCC family protein [Undibacterium luofuense]|uniref:SRPBCC family protein n=1 Tax=Undibacterium luofuense TaxID=2828733 RepID=A0A941DLC3_9BURK|nr:SRPBCC family protein [Undibacterium luofuense]MBR7781925.1 SRPBCC family protein [Undibacterium luofuense]
MSSTEKAMQRQLIEAETNYVLKAPCSRVFAYLSNPANDKIWQGSCVDAQLHAPQPAAGAEYSIKFSFLGRKMDFRARILEVQPESSYAFEVLDGPFYYKGQYRFEADGQHTRIHWHFAAEPGKFFGILPASILRKVLVSQIEKDFITLDRLLAA